MLISAAKNGVVVKLAQICMHAQICCMDFKFKDAVRDTCNALAAHLTPVTIVFLTEGRIDLSDCLGIVKWPDDSRIKY